MCRQKKGRLESRPSDLVFDPLGLVAETAEPLGDRDPEGPTKWVVGVWIVAQIELSKWWIFVRCVDHAQAQVEP